MSWLSNMYGSVFRKPSDSPAPAESVASPVSTTTTTALPKSRYESVACAYTIANPDKCHNLLHEGRLHVKSYLEGMFAKVCDHSPEILEWGYEHISFPYIDENGDMRTYLPDFWLRTKRKVFWIEIKSKSELNERIELNELKWREADALAHENQAHFEVLVDGVADFLAYTEVNKLGLTALHK